LFQNKPSGNPVPASTTWQRLIFKKWKGSNVGKRNDVIKKFGLVKDFFVTIYADSMPQFG
jgi:hypothetical protein